MVTTQEIFKRKSIAGGGLESGDDFLSTITFFGKPIVEVSNEGDCYRMDILISDKLSRGKVALDERDKRIKEIERIVGEDVKFLSKHAEHEGDTTEIGEYEGDGIHIASRCPEDLKRVLTALSNAGIIFAGGLETHLAEVEGLHKIRKGHLEYTGALWGKGERLKTEVEVYGKLRVKVEKQQLVDEEATAQASVPKYNPHSTPRYNLWLIYTDEAVTVGGKQLPKVEQQRDKILAKLPIKYSHHSTEATTGTVEFEGNVVDAICVSSQKRDDLVAAVRWLQTQEVQFERATTLVVNDIRSVGKSNNLAA